MTANPEPVSEEVLDPSSNLFTGIFHFKFLDMDTKDYQRYPYSAIIISHNSVIILTALTASAMLNHLTQLPKLL